ncbi:DeoR family transcriptional regulator [Bosea sp. 62]|uniref:DeoR/GlpR family DNA-binding transcription regulator n=1 Tax=unclassified Bosea (in: a-proteobacteria) TaxID=2653178 RepID=UPI0012577050|nr:MULTISPECIES: DeoR/GlpR family DNA-binding transcription regulator [unclassified Bosea (in: a-proteobacteria)]CAD5296871.1 DeoR family transcriptional regulator [Bosea sp. 7B]CAD5296949.1 DeoR family transcriptional regulator [Bosea sp. 21B]CAD5297228.1 DeoR family transcriptional regulator [Bosea sp. 46]VVT61211.1 DeoR-like helix-turn-helix domain protein [Bosea sp. EC-HK365B]VXB19739.1 DeoR family transcriptional regulator [Bosea sp. 125]
MWQGERKQRIRALLDTFGGVSVERLAHEFGVSNESIRRDLVAMEQDGSLRRVHGGAVSMPAEQDASYGARSTVRLKEKRAIALAAMTLIKSGQTLFLDGGTTTAALAEELKSVPELNILTNSLQVATTMASTQQRTGSRVFLLGGTIVHEPPETGGASTINDIYRYKADLALLSPFGVDMKGAATNFFEHTAEIARAMVINSAGVVLIADHSKIGVTSRFRFCELDRISAIVTDKKAKTLPALAALSSVVGRVIVADA